MPGALDRMTLATFSEANRRGRAVRGVTADVAAMAGPLPGSRSGWPCRVPRADRGRSRFPEPLRLLAEGLALRTPVPYLVWPRGTQVTRIEWPYLD